MLPQPIGPLPITMSLALAITLTGFGACGREKALQPSRIAPEYRSATLYYAPGETDTAPDMLEELDRIAAHERSDPSLRVLVLASANERRDIDQNLTLAEARARNVRRELIARGVPERQIVVAAREALADDPKGARCEVEPIGVARGVSPTISD
jgi:hypothetical protein